MSSAEAAIVETLLKFRRASRRGMDGNRTQPEASSSNEYTNVGM